MFVNVLDTRTVLFSSVITSAICALVMASLWQQNRRRSPELGYWLADFVLQFLAILLVTLRGVLPDVVSVMFGVPFSLTGALLLFIGLERYLGKTSAQRSNFGLLAGFSLVHAYFTFGQPSLPVRNINFSLGLFVFCGQCAWLLLRRVDVKVRPETKAVGVIFSLYSLVSLLRIFADLATPHTNDLFTSGLYDTLAILIYQMLLIGLVFALFLMVNRRLVAALENDIAERRQAEEALRQSEEKFARAFHTSPYAITLTRADDGQFIEVNDAFTLITGFSRAEALADTSIGLRLWVNPDDRQRVVAALRASQTVTGREAAFRQKNGEVITGLFSAQVIRLSQGLCILASIDDITARKRTEDALRELNATLEHHVAARTRELAAANDQLAAANVRLSELDKMKSEFVSRLGHELRTPLTTIKIVTELLERGIPERREKYLTTLKQETDRLQILIEDLLQVSRLDTDGLEVIVGTCDVNQLIRDRLLTWGEQAARRGLEVQVELAADLPLALIDRELTAQVIAHLVHNAISYTPQGTLTLSTAARSDAAESGQWVVISVADTGPGITPADLPHIFERFYRGRAAANYKTPGTGVGLSISREIAQKMGGQLTIETQVGAGSTFTLWLPVA